MLYIRGNNWYDSRNDLLMKVRIVTISGSTLYGSLVGEEVTALSPREGLYWVMNNGDSFIRYLQPNGQEVLLNKSAILNIAEDTYD